MGKLRVEPIHKPPVTKDQYDELLGILHKAQAASEDHSVFYDLGPDEDGPKMRKRFIYVAEQESIPVVIRQKRKERCLSFKFGGEKRERSRMSAEEAKKRILTALVASDKPLRKSEIVKHSGISPSTWNLRISELLKEGSVKREGDRRDSVYSVA